MNWILGSIAVVVLVYVLGHRLQRKKKRDKLKALIQGWGKSKTDEYFNFDLIQQFFRNHSATEKKFHTVSDSLWMDLDMEEVFKFLDRTTSKVGQQYLYSKLRTITSIEELRRFEKLIEKFSQDNDLSLNSQMELSKLSSQNACYLEEIFRPGHSAKNGKIWLFISLALAAILVISFSFFIPGLILLLVPIFFTNLIFHYKNKSSVQSYMVGVKQLTVSYKVVNRLLLLRGINSSYDDWGFLQNIKSLLSRTRLIEWERRLDNEFSTIFWFLSEIIKIAFNIEIISFYLFQKSIDQKKRDIKKMFIIIGEIDAAISCASIITTNKNICKPGFKDTKEIIAEGVYHPLVEDCVENDLHLKHSSLLLTGSNMSGKTTFIRTLGINAIVGQTLNLCFASKFESPFFKIYSSIRIADNLLENTSYFLAEVVRIKELVDASEDEEPCLFILDELLKGTNTAERIAAGKGILSYLNKRNHIVLVSTHDLELTALLKNSGYSLYHFTEHIEEDHLYFDHKLKPGIPKKGNALKILELYDYPLEVITESQNL